jgi:hypothetical protein
MEPCMTDPLARRSCIGRLLRLAACAARACCRCSRRPGLPDAAGPHHRAVRCRRPADVYARFIGQHLQDVLGQSFVVDNRPGAGSIIGTDAVAKSPPDGYTLLLMSNTHTVNESLIPTKPFQLMRDFAPVAPINASDLALVGKAGLAPNTLAELIRRRRRGRAACRMPRRGRAPRTTWPANCSRRWPGSRWSTSRTAVRPVRAATSSAARWT